MQVKYTVHDNYGKKTEKEDLEYFLRDRLSKLSIEFKLEGLPVMLAKLLTKLAEKNVFDLNDINDVVAGDGSCATLPYDWELDN